MIGALLEIAAALILLAGLVFLMFGTIGLLRLPDLYCRAHAATKCDALGAGLTLLGLAMMASAPGDALRILALIALVLVASPTAGHALTRAAWHAGVRPWTAERRDDGE
ncbi:MAG: monovalent cation/H(+) antiporter subunit G [Wenzhouxiangellaceae bacterium]|nr:monovalent cation/H(+) antiporter subunit G [Wenzhouxiangellaceae bacterium]